MYYTIPSDNRELQLLIEREWNGEDYTIPSDNRELQHDRAGILNIPIIPYQVITGNYNGTVRYKFQFVIIPYQVITGNYN